MNSTHCDSSLALSWNITSDYYHFVTLTSLISSIIIAAMSPVTVAGNLLVLLAIWKNQTLRTPSYFLLGVLSLEYFLSGLIIQPSYAAKELVIVLRPPSVINTSLPFYVHLILGGFGTYTTAIIALTTTLMATERWLCMTRRRRWLNSSRVWKIFVALLFQPIPLIVFRTLHILTGTYCQVTNAVIICLMLFCFLTTSLTYLHVYRIIRRHQQQVQVTSQGWAREPVINMAKYKKSVFTVLLILALFYLSYVPFVVNVILHLLLEKSVEIIAAFKVSVMLMFVSSALSPCLYCWRIREIRDGVRQLFCKFENL